MFILVESRTNQTLWFLHFDIVFDLWFIIFKFQNVENFLHLKINKYIHFLPQKGYMIKGYLEPTHLPKNLIFIYLDPNLMEILDS